MIVNRYFFTMLSLILASASPRRKEILKSLGIDFSVVCPSFDEKSVKEKNPINLSRILALKKAECVAKSEKVFSALVLAADTLVFSERNVFGKPASVMEAGKMLTELSGSVHSAVTSICCINTVSKKISERSCVSKVYFKTLAKREIDFYLKTNEWKDAAGAYKIQGAASCFIEKIEGSFSGIMGLPLFELYSVLEEQNALCLIPSMRESAGSS